MSKWELLIVGGQEVAPPAGGRVPARRSAAARTQRCGAGIAETNDPPAAGITAETAKNAVTRAPTKRTTSAPTTPPEECATMAKRPEGAAWTAAST